jgi:nucleotide-binding universal stress UspA family protein
MTSVADQPSSNAVARTLVGVDFSSASQAALDFALALARRQRQSAVHAMHAFVWPTRPLEPGDLPRSLGRGARVAAEQSLRALVASRRGALVPIEAVMIDGEAASTIVSHAASLDCGLVVVGATGRGALRRLLLGSVAERVVRTCATDVVVVPSSTHTRRVRRVVCAVDFSIHSETALIRAVDLARTHEATLQVVHVCNPPPYVERLATVRASIEREHARLLEETAARHRQHDVRVETAMRWGHPATEIVSYARDREADLIVTGANGMGGLVQFLLGSVVERLVRSSPIPVFVARSAIAHASPFAV